MQEQKKGEGQKPLAWQPAQPAPQASAPAASRGIARQVSIFAAGVVVGVLVAWGFSGKQANTVADTNRPAQAGMVINQNGEASAMLEVASPQAAGKRVTVKAAVTEPTWVVVYEQNGSAVGRALGASLFSASKQSGEVTLLRSTVPGKTYYVGLATDNGNGTFSVSADKPVLTGDTRLLVTFVAK